MSSDKLDIIKWIISVTGGVYLFTTSSGLHLKSRMDDILGHDYAHRGLFDMKKKIPENSLTAFRKAAEKGYGIELDVHLTADNHLVVIHDDTLLRMCGSEEKICRTSFADIRKYRLKGTDEMIPEFSEALEVIGGRVPIIVELKVDEGNYNLLCPLVWQVLKDYKGKFCIESFHPGVLMWFRFHHREIARGQLSCDFFREAPHMDTALFLMTNLMSNFLTKPDFIAYKYTDTRNLAYQINKNIWKAKTAVWTIKNRSAYERFKSKADLIIFDSFTP